ncbi:MAG: hypothetical protein CSA22_07890 [Deltaproteobacteria bacterium]|nr:MAG: hypothetical protein CSA22_07890 [Deltaproteobacteria bacterium]
MRILIVKLGALGDVINTFPLAVALKDHLAAEIHWLVAPLSAPFVSAHPCVDQTVVFDKKGGIRAAFRVAGLLRKTRYDGVLDLQRILKSALFTQAVRADRRIGFDPDRCKEMTAFFPFERIPAGDPGDHMARQYMEFSAYLGLPSAPIAWRMPPAASACPLRPQTPYAILNVGATKVANRWFPDRFAELAAGIQKTFGWEVVLTGGPEDRPMAAAIMAASDTCVPVNTVGETRLPELQHLIEGAQAVVSCDTGPMHLAVALGRPVFALFGPADPRRTGPLNGVVIRKAVPCSPCGRKTCNQKRVYCMEAVLPEDVLAAMTDCYQRK